MKSLLTIGLVAAASISTSATSAGLEPGDTITVSRIGTAPGRAIRYNYDSSRMWDGTASGADHFGLAGVNTFATQTGSAIHSFCVEMNEGFVDDPIVYEVTTIANVPEDAEPGPMSQAKQTLMQDLYARHFDSIGVPGDYDGTWAQASDRAAAFQLVVWEISHENFTSDTDASTANAEMSIVLGAMAFTDTFNADVLLMADEMIASLGDGGYMAYTKLLGLTNPSNQDMLIVVPTPAIAGLAGLGLVGMRRRRR
ncbi:MAG: hypothetical protein GY895_20575 [Phycisphaera sp.]|nr:hypothetical protein [Phycisphaera sp.]